MTVLKILLVQFESKPNKEDNLNKAIKFIEMASDDVDIIIFPEYMMGYPETGMTKEYIMNNAENENGKFLTIIREKAKDRHVTILTNIFEEDKDKFYNTNFLIDNKGGINVKYRKIHLFDVLGYKESNLFEAGKEIVTFNYNSFKIGLATCFDIRFPELFRKQALLGVNIFLIPSAMYKGDMKEQQWLVMGQARAHENVAFTVGVGNAASPFIGRSYVIDPLSIIRLDLGVGEKIEEFAIEENEAIEARKILPLMDLRRSELY